jgi:cbb3-type cytochrome oxidase maturation protein
MLEYLTLGELTVALLMGLAALCAFVWGAASGALRDVEDAKHQVLRAESDDTAVRAAAKGEASLPKNGRR